MVFPGVLRGRPGPRLATIHTSRPRRSLSSPWMHLLLECSVRPHPARTGDIGERTPAPVPVGRLGTRLPGGSPGKPDSHRRVACSPRSRRVPGPLRGTYSRLARGPSGGWWRGLTPRWPRSSRLGSASSSNVRLWRARVKGFGSSPRTFRGKPYRRYVDAPVSESRRGPRRPTKDRARPAA